MKNILNIICSHYDIDKSIVFKNCKKGESVFYRQLLIYLIYSVEKGITLYEIVNYLNWNGSSIKTHGTIIHAIKSIKNKLFQEKAFKLEIEILKRLIEENDDRIDLILVSKIDLTRGILR